MEDLLDTVAGLPVHPLVVHATVGIVPLAALAVLAAAVVPRFRRWAGVLPLLLSAAALALVPVTTESGEALMRRVDGSPELGRHMELGEGLLVWVAGVFLAALAVTWWGVVERRATRQPQPGRRAPVWLAALSIVLAAVAGVGTTVQVVQVGHSGATSVWGEED